MIQRSNLNSPPSVFPIDLERLEKLRCRYESSRWFERTQVLQIVARCALALGILLLATAIYPCARNRPLALRRASILGLVGGVLIALFWRLMSYKGLSSPTAIRSQSISLCNQFARAPHKFSQLQRTWGHTESWSCISLPSLIPLGDLRARGLRDFIDRYQKCPELMNWVSLDELKECQLSAKDKDTCVHLLNTMRAFPNLPFPLDRRQVLANWTLAQLRAYSFLVKEDQDSMRVEQWTQELLQSLQIDSTDEEPIDSAELLIQHFRNDLHQLGLAAFVDTYRHCEALSPYMPMDDIEEAQLRLESGAQFREMFQKMRDYGTHCYLFFPLSQTQVLNRYVQRHVAQFTHATTFVGVKRHEALVDLLAQLEVLFDCDEGRAFLLEAGVPWNRIADQLIESLKSNPRLLIDAQLSPNCINQWVQWLGWERLLERDLLQKISAETLFFALSPHFFPKGDACDRTSLNTFRQVAAKGLQEYFDELSHFDSSNLDQIDERGPSDHFATEMAAFGTWPAVLGIRVGELVHCDEQPISSTHHLSEIEELDRFPRG